MFTTSHRAVAAICLLRWFVLCAMTFPVVAVAQTDTTPATIPPPQDRAYQGVIRLNVNASDTTQGIFRVHEVIPTKPGKLTLLYPKWYPAHHAPAARIDRLAGLVITANGKPIAWTRDEYNVYAFDVNVPGDTNVIDLTFEILPTRTPNAGPVRSSDLILDLAWIKLALYPAGFYTRDINVAPQLEVPPNWSYATALSTESVRAGTITFNTVPFNTLCDSPVYAGKYYKRIDLNLTSGVPVHLNMFADATRYLNIPPAQVSDLRALVQQEYALFGSHHYHHYDFLLSLSNVVSRHGLEHHQSSEDGAPADYFTEWAKNLANHDLLAHEFTHSWNGKFRRPADQWTSNFNVPMGNSLLWVYEGLTQYWGYVLTTRAGMWTPQQLRDALALVAATYDRNRPGFSWRDMEDTTNDPVIAPRGALPYLSWQMDQEYYSAGQLMWLAIDAKIRSLTRDRKSLDDFARIFFGMDDGSYVTRTYTFAQLAASLNRVVKYDWETFLRKRINAHRAPLEGITASGWKLVYTNEESAFQKRASGDFFPPISFALSIGLTVGENGMIHDVRWDGPAFKAGVGSGENLVAVNGEAYKSEVLARAIQNAQSSKAPIELLLKYHNHYRTIPVDYHAGMQYPHLVRVDGTPDYLDQILAPRK